MADDTRQTSPPPAANAQDDHDGTRPYHGKVYEVFPPAPPKRPENANLMPGGTANTAGGKLPEPTTIDALKSIRVEDFRELHKKPCVRDALLTGIGSGFAIGGTTAIFGKPLWRACNWAVGSFAAGSFFMYQYCLIRRQLEKDGMKRIVEVRDQKKAEREAKMQAAREARRKAKEEADRLEEETAREAERKKKDSWKFW
ncbi:hypothetical protein W97_06079 [Coniosporium apollinis CBS 100218]|uniref:Cytochrome c oxidase assembly protein COX20, mitochondrial n=1 Tax=Coniosporium apollinis (strain CBS 100218) TaxID=1168221 RepID=R7YYP0_CONA1|nr:uncharacterized protein W97_06079 [Coniosporium apollinis CBS 100218]EON66963.1 hypothetical protein W97_06079 [Coniosporium apollinis CBS 100218]